MFSKNLSVHQSNIDRFYNRNFQGKKGLFVIQETASPSKNQAEAKPDANKISGAVSAAGGMFYKIIQIRTNSLLLGRYNKILAEFVKYGYNFSCNCVSL